MTEPETTEDEVRHRNGSASDRRPRHVRSDWRTWALALLACAFISAVGSAILANDAATSSNHAAAKAEQAALDAASAVADVGRVEDKDSKSARQAAFRLCTRNKVDRAFAHSRIRGVPVKGEPEVSIPGASGLAKKTRIQISRVLMQGEFLPILDCAPNLRGRGAHPLPIKDQEAFIERWAHKQLDAVDLGVCPHSQIGQGENPYLC